MKKYCLQYCYMRRYFDTESNAQKYIAQQLKYRGKQFRCHTCRAWHITWSETPNTYLERSGVVMSPKQVIVWRKDLKVRTGKIAAQVAHASLKAILDGKIEGGSDSFVIGPFNKSAIDWINGDFTKIVLGCNDEAELMALYDKASKAGIRVGLITDNGKTEFKGVPTITCCAFGPDEANKIDAITGHLSLM